LASFFAVSEGLSLGGCVASPVAAPDRAAGGGACRRADFFAAGFSCASAQLVVEKKKAQARVRPRAKDLFMGCFFIYVHRVSFMLMGNSGLGGKSFKVFLSFF
jgi:hypothetical protein